MSSDVMDRLANARPSHLDPGQPPDPATRDRELATAFAGLRAPRPRRRRRFLALAVGGPLTAAVTAAAVAVAATAVPQPGHLGPGHTHLIAALTYGSPPANPGDAAAVLRGLATTAAAQPAPALGPVEYVETEDWGLDDGMVHYGLDYRAHWLLVGQGWFGPHGAASTAHWPDGRPPGGHLPPAGRFPVSPAAWAWRDPATLPSGRAALVRRLLAYPRSYSRIYPTAVSAALAFMETEPLPPDVRASMLRLLADAMARPSAQVSYFDLGAVTDRAGRPGIAIASLRRPAQAPGALSVYIFDQHTGALEGVESAHCRAPVTARTATRNCTPESYGEFLQTKAVRTIPDLPPYHVPTGPGLAPAPGVARVTGGSRPARPGHS